MISFWEVGSWTMKNNFRAYHNSNAKFYGKEFNMDEVEGEFDVAVLTFDDACSLLVCGLYSGVI